jgi:signal transduction histidine kinase
VHGDTDRTTAADLLGPTASELMDSAEHASSLVDVQGLVGRLRQLPGVLSASIGCVDEIAAPPDGYAASRQIGAPGWRQVLRTEFVDVDAYRLATSAVDALAEAAGRTLRRPCAPVPERSVAAPPLYRAITRNARALIIVVDPARGWTPMSDSFSALLGYDRRQPPVADLLSLVHPDDHAAALGTFVTACAGTDPAGCVDLRLRSAAGAWREFEFATRSFVGNPDAAVVAYFGLDVTIQRAAERGLRVERSRLSSLVETLPDGILLIDEDTRLTVANAALRRLLRLAEPVQIGAERGWAGLLARLQDSFAGGAAAAARLRDVVNSGRVIKGEEVDLTDGRVLEFDFVPLDSDSEADGKGTLLHVRDVTARVALRRGLEERNRSLAEAAALNNQFVATVAHELRGPLSSVVAFGHLLGDAGSGMLSEDQRTYLDVIDRNANRLLRLIEDLLLLSRLEARTLQLRTAPVRLADLVRAAVTERVPTAEAAGLNLVVDAVDGPELVCDETRVHQVLDNLMNNALKFTPAGGQVTVRARPTDTGWQLEVADTGVGIPAADLNRVFSAFFRGSNTGAVVGRSAPPGTGLGLVVSRAIVELHGGTIQVSSTEGVGSTVTVVLPARPGARPTRTKDGG